MFSVALKRSAATLGVVAGLLAGAGPARAQILDGPVLAKPSYSTHDTIDAWVDSDCPNWLRSRPKVKLPISGDADNEHAGFCGVDVSADHVEAYVVTNNNDPDAMAIARGTQVGSEGVKDNGVPLETVSLAFKGEVIGLEPNALGTQVGSEGVKAANKLRGEAIDIIPERSFDAKSAKEGLYFKAPGPTDGTQIGFED